MVRASQSQSPGLTSESNDSLVVRVRSREGRRNRAPPPRVRWKDNKKVNPAVAAAEDAKAAAAAAVRGT